MSNHSTRPPPPTPRAIQWLRVFAQIAGLAATGWLIWFASLVPRMDRKPLAVLLGAAVEYALMAWAWSAAVTFTLFLIIPKSDQGELSRKELFAIVLRTASTAVWFGPATILLSMFSPAALAAALVLVVNGTRLLAAEWRPIHAGLKLTGSVAPSMAVSCILQLGMVAILMKYPLLGAALFLMSAAMVTLLSIFAGVSEPGRIAKLPQSALGVLLTIILAAGLTVGGLPISVNRGSRWDHTGQPRPGFLESSRQLLRALLYGEPPDNAGEASDDLATRVYKRGESLDLTDDSYPGVILWPEVKPHTLLVAPMPAIGHSLLGLSLTNPLSIPFSGEYWMYKPPSTRPPQNSFFRRASPLLLGFMTTDHHPLFMEARHKLDQPIDLTCCAAIQIVISNADRYPGTVSLELLLKSAGMHGAPLSLGRAAVTSIPNLGDPVVPASETLSFSVPRSASPRTFDEFLVRFHRDRMRLDRSARIAIERFVLAPRGG